MSIPHHVGACYLQSALQNIVSISKTKNNLNKIHGPNKVKHYRKYGIIKIEFLIVDYINMVFCNIDFMLHHAHNFQQAIF